MIPMVLDGELRASDQAIRPGTTRESLAGLKTVFRPEGGRITAGSSSPISDGAAGVLLASRGAVAQHGLRPRARVLDQTTVGVDPIIMLTGPIPATRKLLERNGMSIDDVDLVEINEAFSPVVLAWEQELKPDMDRVNVNGGATVRHVACGDGAARRRDRARHDVLWRRARHRDPHPTDRRMTDLRQVVKPGDGVRWGQGGAEPEPVVNLLLDQVDDIGPVRAFCGLTWNERLSGDLPENMTVLSYGGLGELRSLS